MLERLIPWDRWYPQRAEGLIDIAWTEGVMPANEGMCPICGPACDGHDQHTDVRLRAFVAPVLSGWLWRMPDRDRQVVNQLLADWADGLSASCP